MMRHPAAPSATEPQPATRRARFLAFLVTATLAMIGALGVPSAAVAFDEGTIHSLVNQSRSANGLGALTLNSSLSQVAAGWANQLAANGTLSHNPSYSSQIPGGWTKAAENVAQGYPSGTAVHDGWMNSPGHRANILGDFTDIGIAHISAGGTTWSVEVFAKYGSSVAPPAPAPPPPAPEPQAAPAPVAPPPPAEAPDVVPAPTPEPAPTASVPDRDPGTRMPVEAGHAQAEDRPDLAQGALGAAAPDDSTTKIVLGTSLLAAVAIALAGWSRFSRRR